MTVVKLLALVVALNIVRYVAAAPFEMWLIFEGLFGAREGALASIRTSRRSIG